MTTQWSAPWKFRLRDIVQVDVLIIAITSTLALVSWTLIERPAMRVALRWTRRNNGRNGGDAVPMVVEDAGAP